MVPTIGISSRRDSVLGGGDCRTGRDRAEGVHVSVRLGSRRLLSNVIQKCLPLLAGQELEES